MKGYAVLLLIAAILLMALPLPAAFGHSSDSAPDAQAPTAPQSPSPSESSAASVFKILVGDEVITLDSRDFLIRTLAFEMAPSYHAEALKAQTVAAYTYYGRRRLIQEATPDPQLNGAHFKTPDDRFPLAYSTDQLQEKWGAHFDENYQKLADIVDEVLGHYILYNGQWIDACYFAISSGATESAEMVWGSDIPYLRSVASPFDKGTTGYEQTVTMTPDAVKQAFLAADATLSFGDDPSTWFGATEKNQTGSLKSVAVGGKPFAATSIRSILGLRSTHFTVIWQEGSFRFTTRGYGHGVGMSQQGANQLAQQGYTWQEILQYYYTDVTIV